MNLTDFSRIPFRSAMIIYNYPVYERLKLVLLLLCILTSCWNRNRRW